MAKKDHLDNEVSGSVEVTPTGVTAKAKSRFVAALDRLIGAPADWLAQKVEADTARNRAIADAEIAAIKAAQKAYVARIGADSALADRAIEGHLGKIVRQQANKEGVAAEAIEDLRSSSPTEEQVAEGPEALSDPFMDRLEYYAEAASTDELRQKWGRVLAAEVRNPGTFSAKTMRVVDEIDAETAGLFERVAAHRIGQNLPLVLVGELSFDETAKLVNSGLLVDSGLGVSRSFGEGVLGNGQQVYFTALGSYAVAIERVEGETINYNGKPLTENSGAPSFPILVLTPEGEAICSILPDNQRTALARLVSEIRSSSAPRTWGYYLVPGSKNWKRIED